MVMICSIIFPTIVGGCCRYPVCQVDSILCRNMAVENFNVNFLKLTQLLDGKNDNFLSNLQTLHSGCKDFMNFASDYDFDEKVQYNGYRSFIKLVAIYFSNIVQLSEGTPSRKKIKQLYEYECMTDILLTFYKFLLLVRQRKSGLEGSDYGQSGSIDEQLSLLPLSIGRNEIQPLYSSIKNFWLCPSIRRFIRKFYLPMIFMKLFPLKYSLKATFSSRLRTKVYSNFAVNASVKDTKQLWTSGEDSLNRGIIRSKNIWRGTVQTAKLPRQQSWIISETGKMMKDPENFKETAKEAKTNTIKVLYIHYGRKGVSPNDSLIFHCHGGGFISMTPRGHEGYLRRFSRSLKVPVISVYYRLAPDNPFPAALQDCLDAYLSIISGNEKVSQLLGFQPKNIVMCGDSAGGNLSVALTYALNDIRKLGLPDLQMPKSLCIQYPVSNPVLGCTAPSRGFIAVDSILAIGTAYACTVGVFGLEKDSDVSIVNKKKPWYRQEKQKVQDVIKFNLEKHQHDSYINILYQNFDDLKDIPLAIQACEFDPLLDDSVYLARKWKGQITLDVIEDVPHGFLSFQDFSPESRKAAKLCAKRMVECLGISCKNDSLNQTSSNAEQ